MTTKYDIKHWCGFAIGLIVCLLVFKFRWLLFWAIITLCGLWLVNYALNELHSSSYKNITHYIPATIPVNITKYVDNQCKYIDALSGDQFETYMVKLLSQLGVHNMQHTQFTHDKGLDAVGYNDKNQKVGFQFKHYQFCVGYDAIEQTIAGGQYYNTDVNYIISTDGFTKDASNNADVINHNHHIDYVKLLDRSDLRHLITKSYVNMAEVS